MAQDTGSSSDTSQFHPQPPIIFSSLPGEPFDLEPYKLPIKTSRFPKIISDLTPFFLLIIRLQEQYSDTARCWIW